jgi:hypothetical protein
MVVFSMVVSLAGLLSALMRSVRSIPLIVLTAACAVPPERAERDRAIRSAIAPCERQYPSVHVVGLDDHGRVHARVPEYGAGELEGFERCMKEALHREFELRPLGLGRLAATAGPASVPMRSARAGLLVPVLINGVGATLMLDTGANSTLIRPQFARRAGIEVPSGAPKMSARMVDGREVSMPLVRTRSVSIGAAVVDELDIGIFDALPHAPEVDGLLGASFLNHFRFTIDRDRQLLSLEPLQATTPVVREWRMPAWLPGDEWRFRAQGPRGPGSYTLTVDGEETVDGVAHYVVKSRFRSAYYVKENLAWHFEKVDGAVTRRLSPAPGHDWPLRVGKSWERNYQRTDAQEGRTQEIFRRCSAVDESTVTVPAGVFLTVHVVCRDRAGRIAGEWWYAEEARNWIRQRVPLPEGERVDELTAYTFKRR